MTFTLEHFWVQLLGGASYSYQVLIALFTLTEFVFPMAKETLGFTSTGTSEAY